MAADNNNNNNNEASTRKSPRILREAAKLLSLAEELQEKIDFNERQLGNTAILVVGLMAAGVGVSFTLAFMPLNVDSYIRYLIVGISASLVFGLILAISNRTRGVRKKVATDKRALFEITDMLRDVESKMAKKLGLSMLERAEMRIRLSRLGIGPGFTGDMLGYGGGGHQSQAERQERWADFLALKALSGQALSGGERAQLTPTVIALLTLLGKITPTEQERSKLNSDELVMLACRGKMQLTPQETARVADELKAVMGNRLSLPAGIPTGLPK